MTLLKIKVPSKTPMPIGNKKMIFSFGFLKILLIASRHFSYKFKIINRALPLKPGIILKMPTKIPFIKFIIVNYMIKKINN